VSHKIIILQHTPLVTPGYFTKLMNEDLVETTIIRLDKGEKIPVNLDIYDGMICLGGPMDTWMEEQYPWIIDEKKMSITNNAKFMHCLPIRRNLVATDNVIDSEQSLIIDQSENRIYTAQHIIKKLLKNG